MRVMVLVKATRNFEAGVMPEEKLLAGMGRFSPFAETKELRPVFEPEDFGKERTPEQDALRARLEQERDQ